ncbi:MAG: RIP metalloprotease RseP [Crocinitomicaceae bacterium]|nr:RIP metalloprotease RseP [Crocinitomicaceae bacterium]
MILALQLLLSLSLLILLHEAGHFIPAKLFKTRVEKFYLFFDPYFSLLKKKIGETEYGIGWLPLGGYVKISGMVDESMDKEQMKKPSEPWEFRSKPAWQRLIIMIGGVTVNVLLGIFIYSMVLWNWGKQTLPPEELTYGVHCDSLLYQFGFRDGDRIIALNGEKPENFGEINKELLLEDIHTITINRFGENRDLSLPEDFGQMLVDSGVHRPFAERIPFVIDSVLSGGSAIEAGVLKGDSITGVDHFYTPYFQDIQRYLKNNAGNTIALHIVRGGENIRLNMKVSAKGTIGVAPMPKLDRYFKFHHRNYTLAEAIPAGFHEAWSTVTDYSSQLKFLFSKSGAKQIGGFATFAKLFPDKWDWEIFWVRTAFISLILAFMNILPIPALDGGHVMFLLWEMITGKAVSQKVLERSQIIGMVLLLGLMVYGNGMDIVRALVK